MKKLMIVTVALAAMATSPAMAAGCCGKKGMCMKNNMSTSMSKGKCCFDGMRMNKRHTTM